MRPSRHSHSKTKFKIVVETLVLEIYNQKIIWKSQTVLSTNCHGRASLRSCRPYDLLPTDNYNAKTDFKTNSQIIHQNNLEITNCIIHELSQAGFATLLPPLRNIYKIKILKSHKHYQTYQKPNILSAISNVEISKNIV